MIRLNRSAGLALLFVLLLVAAFAVQMTARPPLPLYDPSGRGPDGLLLLREWLKEMGYTASVTGLNRFDVDGADLLFVYPGRTPFTTAEAAALSDWVEAGGTAVLVDSRDPILRDHFNFATARGSATARLGQVQPLLPQASVAITGTRNSRRLSLGDDSSWLPLVAEDSIHTRPAAAVTRRGAGWVWLLSRDFVLTNERLSATDSTGQIVPALLRGVPAGGDVRFDTYHLFAPSDPRRQSVESLRDWAYQTTAGWATLFALGLGFVYLLLQGRRLGPAIRVPEQGRRREAAEFVVALAGLQRRTRLTGSIVRQQKQRLKQRVGRAWQVPAALPDAEFVARLAAADPTLDSGRLARLLDRLDAATDEASLVQLIQEMEGDPLWTSRT